MKKNFERPELIIVLFENEDIVTASGVFGAMFGEPDDFWEYDESGNPVQH